MILRVPFRGIFTTAIGLVGVVFGLAVGRCFAVGISLFDSGHRTLSIISVAFSLVARGELSQIAVRCASSAVNVLDNISFDRKARCSALGFSVVFCIAIPFFEKLLFPGLSGGATPGGPFLFTCLTFSKCKYTKVLSKDFKTIFKIYLRN